MRVFAVMLVVLVGAGVTSAQDDAQEEARAVVLRAIKAMKLEGKGVPKGVRIKAKGTVEVLDEKLEWANVHIDKTLTIGFPYRFKEIDDMTFRDEKVRFTTIYDGQSGWIEDDRRVREVEDIGLKDYHEQANLIEVTQFITPLLDQERYKIKVIGMALVEGRRAAEVRVSRKGFRDIRLFFDYRTHLLVKAERKGLDPLVGAPCKETRLYRGYKEMNGRMVPGSIALLRNDELIIEMQIIDYTVLSEVVPGEFVRSKQ